MTKIGKLWEVSFSSKYLESYMYIFKLQFHWFRLLLANVNYGRGGSMALTSGVFQSHVKTRDNRRFQRAAEKTLQGQGLESVSAEGNRAMLNAEEEGDDPLLWPGVRPPEVDPG